MAGGGTVAAPVLWPCVISDHHHRNALDPKARPVRSAHTWRSCRGRPRPRDVRRRSGEATASLCRWSDGVVAAAGSTVDHGFPPGVTSRPRGAWSASHMLRGGMFAARRASVLDSSARPQLDLGRVWLCPPSIGPEASGSRLRGGSRPPSGRPSPRHAASGRPSVPFLSEVDGSCASKDSLRESQEVERRHSAFDVTLEEAACVRVRWFEVRSSTPRGPAVNTRPRASRSFDEADEACTELAPSRPCSVNRTAPSECSGR